MAMDSSLENDQANDAYKSACNNVKDLGGKATQYFNDVLSSAGEKLSSLGDMLKEKAPSDSSLGSSVESVAEGLKSSGDYLADKKISDIAGDMGQVIKKYPVHSMWAGVGLGFLFGHLLSGTKR